MRVARYRQARKSLSVKLIKRCLAAMILTGALEFLPMGDFKYYPAKYHLAGADPKFTNPMGNTTARLGRTTILQCSIKNLGTSNIAWMRVKDEALISFDQKLFTKNKRFTVSNDSTTWRLKISPFEETDSGCYICQIHSSIKIEQLGCVSVEAPPDIIDDDISVDQTTLENENATLGCNAVGNPKPRIYWRREDKQPIVLKKHGNYSKQDIYDGSLLQFWNLRRSEMGVYLCIATNGILPTVSKRITLTVNFPPTMSVSTQLLGAVLDTDVQLQCYIESFPSTLNYWSNNNGEILYSGDKYDIKEERFTYKLFMKLVVKKFSEDDIGNYSCVSANFLGKSEGNHRLYAIQAEKKDDAVRTSSCLATLKSSFKNMKAMLLISFISKVNLLQKIHD